MTSKSLIFAGQAGVGYYPQNSLEAAAFSTALGVDGIEISVQWTRDQQLVCHQHQRLDPAFTRSPDGCWLNQAEQWPIGQLSYAELMEFRLGELNPERQDQRKPRRQMALAHPIPLLSDMLSQLSQQSSGQPLQLLIHLPSLLDEIAVEPALIRAVLQQVLDYRTRLHIIFTSYDWRLLALIKQAEPAQICWYRLHPPAWYHPDWGQPVSLSEPQSQALLVQQGWHQQQLPWLDGLSPVDYHDLIAQAKGRGWRLYCHHTALPYLSDASDVALWTEQQHQPEICQLLANTAAYAVVSDSPFSYSHLATAKCRELVAFGKACLEKKKWQALIDSYLPIVQSSQARCHFELVYRLAIALRREQRFNESEQVLQLGLKAYPHHHNLYIELAALENQRENWSQALNYWYKAFHIAEGFSVMSYQRLTKAIIMSTEQRPGLPKRFIKPAAQRTATRIFRRIFPIS
ncbi:glycerophosphodiester phosphodiesterase family protein [Alkalimonas amylolytica]|uniref:Glycerophosphoryl diester phosphodiesterase n=1 Tax=Alkalimonas amylolytica TaxID=152573 RepID=A0A1H4A1P6_ALKAM|nr:glycerophosphodiester phosphodiesterase family protein [Alkalimonas amylolytica]SEA29837.1 Glycerophosphoryl diester phosphodiesterase [Alkalimonas amylolytica]